MEFLVTVTSASTSFVDRHIGARRQADVDAMLKAVGYDTVDALVDTMIGLGYYAPSRRR
jgi:glycine dehydrogenase